MCSTLSGFKGEFLAFVAGFDAALLAPGDLSGALACAGAIEKAASALSALIAARMARLGKASSSRHQAARCLAQASGTSLKEAEGAIEAAEKMASQPELCAAARLGQLSRAQAAIVSAAASANPAATGALLSKAATGALSELACEAARARAAAGDPGAQREALHRARSLRSYTDPSGTWHLHAQGLPEDGAKVMAALQPKAGRLFDEARCQGRREPPEAYAFDALVELATSGAGGTPPAEVVFRVDLEAFLRGYPAEGEVMEVAGFGPASAEAIKDVLEHGTPFLKAVITKGRDVAGVAHLGRRPNAHQRTALDWLYPTCAAEGCGVRADFCETDHRRPWSESHFTLLSLLDRLCRTHHKMKTHEGWALVKGKGKRPFVGPADPRHPRFSFSAGGRKDGGAGTGPAGLANSPASERAGPPARRASGEGAASNSLTLTDD